MAQLGPVFQAQQLQRSPTVVVIDEVTRFQLVVEVAGRNPVLDQRRYLVAIGNQELAGHVRRYEAFGVQGRKAHREEFVSEVLRRAKV
jgi:hypothetical protein